MNKRIHKRNPNRNPNRKQWLARAAFTVVLGLAVAACSGGSDEANSTAAQLQAAKAKRMARQAKPEDPLAGMVKAITASKGNLPLELRFELVSRPEPGKPVDIKLAFVPTADLQAMHAVLKSVSGLQTTGELQADFAALKAGEIKEHSFAATAPTSGIFLLVVEVTVTRETGDNTYVYSIPVAVPNPLPAATSSVASGMRASAG